MVNDTETPLSGAVARADTNGRTSSRRLPLALWLLLVAWVAILLGGSLLPDGRRFLGPGGLERAIVVAPWVRGGFWWGGVIGFVSLLGVSVWALCKKQRVWAIVAVCVAMGGALGTVGKCVIEVLSFKVLDPGYCTLGQYTDGPDGETYCTLYYGFGQGVTVALGRVAHTDGFDWYVEVLGETGFDYPRSWAPMVRPAADAVAGSPLYVTGSGMLLYVVDNKCWLAYDTTTHRFIGHGEVEQLSPFLMIGPNAELYAPDIERISSGSRGGGLGETIRPNPQRLREALSHPNAAVRDAAREMLKAANEDP